jgi:hypothetical protein
LKRLVDFLRGYGLLFSWLAFGPITANAARNPGYVLHPETVPYPWSAAVMTWGILGLETAVVYLILRSPRRLPIALSLVALLFTGSVLTTVTDMAGYYYVPTLYHLVLLLTLGTAWAFSIAVRRRQRQDRSAGTTA